MRKPFTIGDRVRVYGPIVKNTKWLGSFWQGVSGTVIQVCTGHAGPGTMIVETKEFKDIYISVRQCRRLRRKPKLRSLWVTKYELENEYDCSIAWKCPPANLALIQFKEVKKP